MSKTSARAEMLIHKPVAEVFDAFVKPATLEKFWLNKASGPLAKGARVDWEFMVPGARETVTVHTFVANKEIGFTWSDELVVAMLFHAHDSGGTKVSINVSGFSGRDIAAQAVNATEGFAIVLCDLKSLLETGRSGNMVRDKAVLITESKA